MTASLVTESLAATVAEQPSPHVPEDYPLVAGYPAGDSTRRNAMFGGGLEGPGLLIILAIVLVLFGGKKLPGLAKGLGQAKREFEDASTTEKASPADTAAQGRPEMVTMTRAELDELLASHGAPTPPRT